MVLFNKRAGRRRGKAVGEGFDAGHPVAEIMRSLESADVEMESEARERLMGHLFAVQRRVARERPRRGWTGWKAVLITGVAAAAAIAVALAIMMPAGPEKTDPVRRYARAGGLIGNVEVLKHHGEWRAVVDGESIEAGTSVRTGDGSFATLIFADGSLIRISDGSEARIKGLGEQSVSLEHVRGGTYHRVNKGTRYTVTNQDVSSRALGTAFNVDNRVQDNLEILTVQSAVEVRIGGLEPIKVEEGEVMVVSLSEDKKAVKRQVSRERLAEGKLYANVQQDAQDGYSTGIYEQVDVEPEELAEEESDGRDEVSPVICLEGSAAETGVSLNWSWSEAHEGDFHELVVLRSDFSEPVYPDDEIARYSDVSIKTANDDSVTGGQTYQYRLAARSGYGSIIYSNTVVITVPVPEPEPEPASMSLSASTSANGVTLEWSISGVTNFNGFVVERMVEAAPKKSKTPAGRVDVTRIESGDVFYTYLDDDAAPKHTYTYRVGLVVEGAVMIYSNSATMSAPLKTRFEKFYRASAVTKNIVVSLADQRLYCLENNVVVNIFRCSTGSIGPTPTGRFRIYGHRRWVDSCEYWMDWKTNYGIHAWPRYSNGYGDYEESLGVRPRSHGCIRLHPLEAYWPYTWAPDGTPLTVMSGHYGKLPLKGSNCSLGATELSKTWYFAEGYIDANFIEYLLLFNPGPDMVEVKMTYYPEGHPPITDHLLLEPGGRHTVSVNNVPGIPYSVGHSIRIEATGGIIAQQSEYFDLGGRRGGHTAIGVTEPSLEWYFGEGYTGGLFSTYLLLFNPNDERACVSVTYNVEGGAPYVHEFKMPPNSRGTTLVNALPGLLDKSVAICVESTEPLVAERTEYFAWAGHPNGVNGGNAAKGLSKLSKTWYLAEGCTGHFFDEYLLIFNPGDESTVVTVEFLSSSGTLAYPFWFPPRSRGTIAVDSVAGLSSAETAAIITSDTDIAVERSMYYARDSRRGGHVSTGASDTSRDWYFAEGYTGGTFDEYLLLLNPGDQTAVATLLFHLENGADVGAQYAIGPKSRVTVPVDAIPGLAWTASAVEIHSDLPIVAEQSHYFCLPR